MRNIVICCDGTGNEISENISNVLKLYRCLRKTEKTTPRQLVFYDPGVGTLARPDPWHRLKQDFSAIMGLATGYGLDDKVLASYHFLVQHYQEGDQIYLFGFSRGAYTVRVLAGLIHKIGLIAPEQANLAGSGLISYKQFSSDGQHDEKRSPRLALKALLDAGSDEDGPLPASKDDQAAQFARILSTRWPTVRFVGVWDTVASVIVPRPDRLYWPSLEELAFTLQNPSVQTFRQAISIDERRSMFRLKQWDAPQSFMHNRFSKTNNEAPQDILQVWFAGVHSDIGGGYPERGLSDITLNWMIEKAKTQNPGPGLKFDNEAMLAHVLRPDPLAMLHDSKTGLYRLTPGSDRPIGLAAKAPNAAGDNTSRNDPAQSVHVSVLTRWDTDASYRPQGLKDYFIRIGDRRGKSL